jgi:hypothetical protein
VTGQLGGAVASVVVVAAVLGALPVASLAQGALPVPSCGRVASISHRPFFGAMP